MKRFVSLFTAALPGLTAFAGEPWEDDAHAAPREWSAVIAVNSPF